MRQRLCGALCAGLLLCACVLGLFGSAAASSRVSVYFMAVNDTVLDLRSETMPFSANGDIYVPYTVFDPNATGISLGVFTAYSNNTVMIYSRTKGGALTFDLTSDNAYASSGQTFFQTAIRRNSIIFVPVNLVCSQFGLTPNLLLDQYGFIVRIKNSAVQMSDDDFAASARYILTPRYNAYVKSIGGDQVIDDPQPSTTPVTPPPTPVQPEGGDVYLAFRCAPGGDTAPIAAALARYGASALFFFAPEELAGRDDEIRALAAVGHRIGLLLSGETEQERVREAEEGRALLAHILRAGTNTVLTAGAEDRPVEGWFRWRTTVDGTPDGETDARRIRSIVQNAVGPDSCFLLLDDSARSQELAPQLLDRLSGQGCTFRLAVETVLARG